MSSAPAPGLEIPPDFPSAAFHELGMLTGPFATKYKEICAHLAGGWHGVRYRFKACTEYGESFIASIVTNDSPSQPERYHQERNLFGFFVSGYSAIECFAFSAHALGAIANQSAFPMQTEDDLKAIYPKVTSKRFNQSYHSDQIACELRALVNSDEFANWTRIRNVLAHRAQPPRIFNIGGDNPPVVWSELNLSIDAKLISENREWLAGILRGCMTATVAFAKANLT